MNRYNFGCMTASNSLFDSRGWVFGIKLSDDDIAEIEESKGRCHGIGHQFCGPTAGWLCVTLCER